MKASCFVTGVFLTGLALRNAWKGPASRQWIQVSARIERSFVLVQEDDGSKGHTPQVEYEYVIEGKSYRGSRLRYGQIGSPSRGHAEKVLAAYPLGSRVPAFVNPRKHKDAVLVTGMSWGNLVIALAGLSFMGASFMMN